MCIDGLNARCKDDATAVVSARFVRYVPSGAPCLHFGKQLGKNSAQLLVH